MSIASERLMRLPSLNALHAFEAAARHQSFAKAALELHVSQGAVSRHVKVLEEQLGIQLFRRQPQGVELTTQGKTLRFRQVSRQLAVRRVVGVDEPF